MSSATTMHSAEDSSCHQSEPDRRPRELDSSCHQSEPDSGRPRERLLMHSQDLQWGSLPISDIENMMHADADLQDAIIPIMCEILQETVQRNDKKGRSTHALFQCFEGELLTISASAYVERILKYSQCTAFSVMMGVFYLQRMKRRLIYPIYTTSTNLRKLLLVAVMSASKFFDDFGCSNIRWGQIGGLQLEEINALELEFLFLIMFDLNVRIEEYEMFLREILFHVADYARVLEAKHRLLARLQASRRRFSSISSAKILEKHSKNSDFGNEYVTRQARRSSRSCARSSSDALSCMDTPCHSDTEDFDDRVVALLTPLQDF